MSIIVIGGGLAGLMATLVAARAGKPAMLLERGKGLGGRAQTQDWKGFHLNLGAHALFRGGRGYALLQEMGLLPDGAVLNARGRALRGGNLHLLPAGPLSMLRTSLLGWREKGAFLSLMAGLSKADLKEAAGLTCRQWLERHAPDAGAAETLGAIFRTSAYAGDLDRLSAATALRRVLESQKGIYYFHGGWGALARNLAGAAEAAGACLRPDTAVVGLEARGAGFAVRTSSGQSLEAEEVILALPPSGALELLPEPAATRLRGILGDAPAVTASCLDLCLSKLPKRDVCVGLGIDEPLFMGAQSETARLAPEGAALVHLLRYHEGRPAGEAAMVRARMEAFMDQLQPGWREALLHARFLPSIPVASRMDEPGAPRPVSEDLGMPGLHLAGDWVGPEGWLADASLASGHRAGLSAASMKACA